MTRYVVTIDRRLAELEDNDRDDWLAWFFTADLDTLEIACPSELIWNDRAGTLKIETLKYGSLGRTRRKYTFTISGEMPPIPGGYEVRTGNNARTNL